MISPLRIANAQAFWGDRNDAARLLMQQDEAIDFITLDYLAEVSMSIMAIQRDKNPSLGYARDFIEVVRSLIPFWKKGSKTKIVTNAGGLNPRACGHEILALLRSSDCSHLKVAVVSGDDVLENLKGDSRNRTYNNLESGESLDKVKERLVTANAYLGADKIVEALKAGADIVVTGRVADPSLTVAPCIAHFNWKPTQLSEIAGATIAGHLIECGTQATGGFSTDWLDLPSPHRMGYPIVEVNMDGSCMVTKPEGSGGLVTVQTVKEQLLYEIGDPGNYISPDCTVSLMGISLTQKGKNRVLVSGAKGSESTPYYKVSATYRDGFKAHGTLAIVGKSAVEKGKKCGETFFKRLEQAGWKYDRKLIECLGGGSIFPVYASCIVGEIKEIVLRLSVADQRKEAIEAFGKEIAPLVTSGPQGVSGYTSGRPKAQPVFGYWPCLIEKNKLSPRWEMIGI